MDHPPYSPSRTILDFHLLGSLKKHLADKQFAADIDMKQAVTSWLQTLETGFFFASIQALMPQWDKCFNCPW
jgi:hypothetical protein